MKKKLSLFLSLLGGALLAVDGAMLAVDLLKKKNSASNSGNDNSDLTVLDGVDSQGLRFHYRSLSNDYEWVGTDGAFSGTSLSIPGTFRGKPVRSVRFSSLLLPQSSVTSFVVPEGVTSIEGSLASFVFPNLSSFLLPSSLQKCHDISSSVLNRLNFNSYGDGLYLGNSTNPYLYLASYKTAASSSPSLANGCHFIGAGVFSKSAMTSFSFSGTLYSIGAECFSSCSALTSFSASGLTAIGDYAFQNCSKLNGFSFGNNLEKIGSMAFYGADSLSLLSLPDSLTNLGSNAFPSASSSISYYKENGNVYLRTTSSYRAFLISVASGLTTFSVPSDCLLVAQGAMDLSKSTLVSVSFLGASTLLSDGVFSSCNALTFVSLPSQLKSLSKDCFSGCLALTWVDLPSSLQVIASNAFLSSGLTSIVIPDSVVEINEAFAGLSSLTGLTLGKGLVNLASGTFEGCSALSSVSFPSTLKTIGFAAFFRCEKLDSITLPEGLVHLDSGAFFANIGISRFDFSSANSLYGISSDGRCLYEKSTLQLVGFASKGLDSTTYSLMDGITSIGTGAMAGFTGNYVSFPKSVKKIGNMAFSFSKLKLASFPYSLSVGEGAFEYCSSLTSIDLSNVTSLGDYAFSGTAFPSVTISASIQTIEGNPFADSTFLTSFSSDSSRFSVSSDKRCLSQNGHLISLASSGLVSYTMTDSTISTIGANSLYTPSSLSWLSFPNVQEFSSHCLSLFSTSLHYLILPAHALILEKGCFEGAIPETLCFSSTSADYKNMVTDWNGFTNLAFYSATQPTTTTEKSWHYVNSEPTLWNT